VLWSSYFIIQHPFSLRAEHPYFLSRLYSHHPPEAMFGYRKVQTFARHQEDWSSIIICTWNGNIYKGRVVPVLN